MSGGEVTVVWEKPGENQGTITYYKIMFRNGAGTDFYEQTTDCDGRDASIVAAMTCTIPMGTLAIAPYYLEHGTSIFV